MKRQAVVRRNWEFVLCCAHSITGQSKHSAAWHRAAQHSTASVVTSKTKTPSRQADEVSPSPPLFPSIPLKQQSYLAKVVALQVRSPTFDLIPHALHVMQVIGLVPVLGEHCSCLLCLLDLPCPELPLSSLTVQEPAPQ